MADRRSRTRKSLLPDVMGCEALEGRLVLSFGGMGGFAMAGPQMVGLGGGLPSSNLVGGYATTGAPMMGIGGGGGLASGGLMGDFSAAGLQAGGSDVPGLISSDLAGGFTMVGSQLGRFDVVAPPSGDFFMTGPQMEGPGAGVWQRGGPDVGLQPSASLVGSLSTIGVIVGFDQGALGWADGPAFATSDQDSQLGADLEKLQSDLEAIAAKSGVTLVELKNLIADDRAIAEAGFQPDATAMQDAVGKLAQAVASGADTSEAQAAFNALFADSSVSQDVIDKAFADLVQTIQDSHITVDDLQTIAADRQAVQSDLESLKQERPGTQTPSGPGGSLLGTLADLGIVGENLGYTFGDPTGHPFADPTGSTSATSATQIGKDMAKLQDDVEAVAAKSGVTVADMKNLAADEQAIAQAATPPDSAALQAALKSLATAVASGADTAQAKADFAAAFANSTVDQETIDKTLTDVAQTIQDSHITTDELQTIAADHEAIQDDLSSLPQGSKSGGLGDIVSNSGGVQSGVGATATFSPATRHPRGAGGRFGASGAGRARFASLAARRSR